MEKSLHNGYKGKDAMMKVTVNPLQCVQTIECARLESVQDGPSLPARSLANRLRNAAVAYTCTVVCFQLSVARVPIATHIYCITYGMKLQVVMVALYHCTKIDIQFDHNLATRQ